MMRMAIAGLGAVAQNVHLPAYARLRGKLVLAGACDSDENARARFAVRHPKVPVFASLPEMARTAKPEIIAICTPPGQHRRQCLEALEQGCHVFCEKPVAETLVDADTIIAAASTAGKMVVVNSQFPYMKCHMAAKSCIGRPEFGRLLFLHAAQTFRPTAQTEAGWRGNMSRRLGLEFGVHVFELVRFFFGEDPLGLFAHMPRPASESDVLHIINLEFSGGRAASILLDRMSKGPERYLDIRLDGECAAITSSIGGEARLETGLHPRERRPFLAFHFAKGGKAVLQDGLRSRLLATDSFNPFASATATHLENFLEAIARKVPPRGEARDHRRTLALVEAAYDSAATRSWVELVPYLAARP